jgi:hypothetical protein
MKWLGGSKLKRMVFSIDAVFALLITLAVVAVIALFNTGTVSHEFVQRDLHLAAEDVLEAMNKVTLQDLIDNPAVADLYRQGTISEADLNKTIAEFIGGMWATENPVNLSIARNFAREVIGGFVPKEFSWAMEIEDDTIYNTSFYSEENTVSVARRMASGTMREKPGSGCVARAFVENIAGKQESAYFFFGGFVGEGNLTAVVRDIPSDAQVKHIYLELNAGDNFTLYINSKPCQDMSVGETNFTVYNWTITNATCIGYLAPGSANNFSFVFNESNLTKSFFGGGYLKVVYSTNRLVTPTAYRIRQYLPGISGLINLFDSCYVPGNISYMNSFMHFYNYINYTAIMRIGNTTVMNSTGSTETKELNITNQSFAGNFSQNNLTLLDLSGKTVPLRVYVYANVTGGNLSGLADVVLITDVSGSMAWRMDTDTSSGAINVTNCSNSSLYDPKNTRINVAKCLDKDFINAILGGNESKCQSEPLQGNRMAVVDFSTDAHNYEGLTNDLQALIDRVNSYRAVGSTCLSCAINLAHQILSTQSNENRSKYVVVMTDGEANVRGTPTCSDTYAVSTRNSTRTFAAGDLDKVVASGKPSEMWIPVTSPSENTIRRNGLAIFNDSLGFAVGDAGLILKWNGTHWNQDASPTGNDLRPVALLNGSLAFAGDSTGRIWKWNGNTWAYDARPLTAVYGIAIRNSTLAFAVGANTGSNNRIAKWDGSTWSLDATSTTSGTLYDTTFLNSSYAFAVGSSGRIFDWNGNMWVLYEDLGNFNIRTVDAFNNTFAMAAGDSGRIYKWTGGTWSQMSSPTSDQINGVSIYNGSYAVTVALDGSDEIIFMEWDGATWRENKPKAAYVYWGNETLGTDCGDSYDDVLLVNQSYPALNANYSAWRIARAIKNSSIDAIGFGPIATTSVLGNTTLKEIAKTGNGSFYASNNATVLQQIYCTIAQNIIIRSTQTQQITALGNLTNAILYPDSYLEFEYVPSIPEPGYREISVGVETQVFNSCNATFWIPPQIRVIDAEATAYSGEYWMKLLQLNNSLTNGFTPIYNLSAYGPTYTGFGDPFQTSIPASLIKTNETNYLKKELGLNATLGAPNCSKNDRLIYSGRLSAFVPYGDLFPECSGSNVSVCFDSNLDGYTDGCEYIETGAGRPGFNSTPKTVEQLNATNNALDEALARLLANLNFVPTPGGSGPHGSSTNPIDLRLGSSVGIEITPLGGVRVAWGPADIKILLWV